MTIDWIGLIEYLVRAWFLLYFCKDSIVEKEKYRSTGKILFFLQSFLKTPEEKALKMAMFEASNTD